MTDLMKVLQVLAWSNLPFVLQTDGEAGTYVKAHILQGNSFLYFEYVFDKNDKFVSCELKGAGG